MRAFIFSLDAFVAFTLALITIYSLIFFSSIPSSYYYLLTQGHFLSRDVLMTLSTTVCTAPYDCKSEGDSVLDNIVAQNDPDLRKNLIQDTFGRMVPPQFGYVVEIRDPAGSWQVAYDTSGSDEYNLPSNKQHAASGKKMSVSSQVISFGYSSKVSKPMNSTYRYLTCNNGDADAPLITCGAASNSNPTGAGGSDLVPQADARIVKLTVFI